jgi:hypothetical protein
MSRTLNPINPSRLMQALMQNNRGKDFFARTMRLFAKEALFARVHL